MSSEPKLCYVSGNWAYFTTQPLADQWGDDWNDAPYEHNAGEPYEPAKYYYADGRSENRKEDFHADGSPKWEIMCVAWRGPFDQPSEGHCNSPYSVQDINAGAIPWLRVSEWRKGSGEPIPAGVTLSEFIRLVRLAGGKVYLESRP